MGGIDLARHDLRGYRAGRPYWFRALWLIVECVTLLNPVFVPYRFKTAILRTFGARVGNGVVIKPNVHIKYPWRLSIGDHSWIGERSWIDNLANVRIGSNVCMSQGAYLCTGNHDWTDPHMGLVVREISVEDGAWIGAFARIAPGVTVGSQSVITLGSVVLHDAEPSGIYRGNPAVRIGRRFLHDGGSLPTAPQSEVQLLAETSYGGDQPSRKKPSDDRER
jgi:putative colanic acid biosynthesis acetyltransferase WcaF